MNKNSDYSGYERLQAEEMKTKLPTGGVAKDVVSFCCDQLERHNTIGADL